MLTKVGHPRSSQSICGILLSRSTYWRLQTYTHLSPKEDLPLNREFKHRVNLTEFENNLRSSWTLAPTQIVKAAPMGLAHATVLSKSGPTGFQRFLWKSLHPHVQTCCLGGTCPLCFECLHRESLRALELKH